MPKYTSFSKIMAPADCQCQGCKKLIPRGNVFIWLRNEGTFHEDCAVKADLIPDTRKDEPSE